MLPRHRLSCGDAAPAVRILDRDPAALIRLVLAVELFATAPSNPSSHTAVQRPARRRISLALRGREVFAVGRERRRSRRCPSMIGPVRELVDPPPVGASARQHRLEPIDGHCHARRLPLYPSLTPCAGADLLEREPSAKGKRLARARISAARPQENKQSSGK